jgi:imidazole glycerol-phosphate synthase subunit HisH
MKKVTIINYGMSNLLSISRAMEKIGTQVLVTESAEQIASADLLILPGVGAFYDGMHELKKRNIPEAIHHFLATGNPFLGICLGMQMMLGEGTEIKATQGLNIIPGTVQPLPDKNQSGRMNTIPHIGWSELEYQASSKKSILPQEIEQHYMYFVHSYYANPEIKEHTTASTPFSDMMFTSVVNKDNAWGTQFHPEKSGESGLKLLHRFIQI